MYEIRIFLKSGQTAEFEAQSLPEPGDVPNWIASLTNAQYQLSPTARRKLVYLNLAEISAIVGYEVDGEV